LCGTPLYRLNVLLAEAGVDYDIVDEMEEVNDSMDKNDVVLVIGANGTSRAASICLGSSGAMFVHLHVSSAALCVRPALFADTVNPSAEDDPDSELYGMPVVRVWKAGHVYVLKRSLGAGYSGSESSLFYKANTSMLLGNASDTCDDLRTRIKEHYA
jgi:NAD/NADP transhydrogenase beta subunit